MGTRAKYKAGELIEFTFAGSVQKGEILEVRRELNKISYKVVDAFYTYPVNEDSIIKKI